MSAFQRTKIHLRDYVIIFLIAVLALVLYILYGPYKRRLSWKSGEWEGRRGDPVAEGVSCRRQSM